MNSSIASHIPPPSSAIAYTSLWKVRVSTPLLPLKEKASQQKLRILSIDGGGIRGIIPATILWYLEDGEAIFFQNFSRRLTNLNGLLGENTVLVRWRCYSKRLWVNIRA